MVSELPHFYCAISAGPKSYSAGRRWGAGLYTYTHCGLCAMYRSYRMCWPASDGGFPTTASFAVSRLHITQSSLWRIAGAARKVRLARD